MNHATQAVITAEAKLAEAKALHEEDIATVRSEIRAIQSEKNETTYHLVMHSRAYELRSLYERLDSLVQAREHAIAFAQSSLKQAQRSLRKVNNRWS